MHASRRARAATAALLLSSFASSADMAVTENHRPRMGVVVSADELNSMQITPWQYPLFKEALADFKKHLSLVSGADFAKLPDDLTGQVRIGRAALVTPELKAEASTLAPGAYIIRTHGNDVLIFGREVVGDISGMYGFLREFAGIEFMGQNELFHIIPKKDIVLPDRVDLKVVPSFFTRRHGGSHHPENPGYFYGVRCGNFCEAYQHELAPNHSYYRILHPATYRKEHPEYYALWEGKRSDPGPTDHQWQLCLSNPAVIDHMIADARNAFANDARLCYEIVPNDSMQICQCENCRTLIPPGGSESDLFMSCVNQVAKAVAAEFPDRYIGILAYGVTNTPPLCAIEPNVFIGYTPDFSQWYDEVFREQELDRMRQWRSRVKDDGKKHPAGWHVYESGGCILPRYFPHHYADTMKMMFNEFDVVAYSGDSLVSFWPWAGPQNYLISRLLWDITLDTDEVLDHYFNTLYGPAARPVRAFHELLEKRYLRKRSGGRWLKDWGWGIDPIYLYSAEDVKQLRGYLAKAERLAKDSPDARRRVAYIAEKLAPVLDMMETFSIAMRLNSGRRLPKVGNVERCIDVLATLEERWKQLIMSDPSLCQYSAEDIGSGTRQAWQRMVESELAPAVATLLQARPHDTQVQALYAKFAATDLQKAKVAVHCGTARLGDNVIQNPGFETRGDDHPVGPDWRASGLLHWSYWNQAPQNRLGISTEIKHSGNQSAFINAADGDCYIAVVPLDVADGKRIFRIAGHIYRTDRNTAAKIEVAWQNDQEGRMWRYASYSTMELKKCNEWERVELVVEAPADAQRGQVLLWTESTAGSVPVYFDDISFGKVSLPTEVE